MAVFWPKDCNAEGCRYDIFRRPNALIAPDTFIGTLRAYYLRSTDQVRNGLPIFVDANRRAYWWDGDKFRRDPKDMPVTRDGQCASWLTSKDDLVRATEVKLTGVLGVYSTGAYFVAMKDPICIWTKSGKYVQQEGNQVQLSAEEKTLAEALSFVGEVEIDCAEVFEPETIHWRFRMGCLARSFKGDTISEGGRVLVDPLWGSHRVP